MSNNTDTFESFGIGFQNCVLQGLITDRVFFEKSFETLKDDYFTSDAHKTLWTEIRKLFNKYNTPPSYETVKVEISTMPDGALKEDTIEVLLDIQTRVNRQEIEYAKDNISDVMRLLEDSLAEEVLSEKIKAGDTAVVDVGEDNKVKVLLGEKFDVLQES